MGNGLTKHLEGKRRAGSESYWIAVSTSRWHVFAHGHPHLRLNDKLCVRVAIPPGYRYMQRFAWGSNIDR